MRRVLLFALLAITPALAGCEVPPGVPGNLPGEGPSPHEERSPPFTADLPDLELISAMRDAARPRAAIAGEAAYDAYLENATRWAREGLDDFDAARPFNASEPHAATAFVTLESLRNASRASDKEVLAGSSVRLALSVRHGLTNPETDLGAVAAALLEEAGDEVARANATVHEVRLATAPRARDHLLRAQATLGLALTQVASAKETFAKAGGNLTAASTSIDARINAHASLWWAGEARRLSEGEETWKVPEGLDARVNDALARAVSAIARAHTSNTLGAVTASKDVEFGIVIVQSIRAAGLPEGAWAASQGLDENVLVVDLALADESPSRAQVFAAWENATANVRTFRDAQRYDRALATATDAADPFGGFDLRMEHLRAFAAVQLMREISEERERVLGEPPA